MNAPFDAETVARNAVRDAQANAVQGDGKRPLFRPLLPPPDYPLDALGPLRMAAEAIHETVRAPVAICAQSVLAAATLAIQAHNDVLLPSARRPLTGLFVSVAESGERKTSVDGIALRPVHAAERQFRDESRREFDAYANAKEAWESARAHEKKVAKGNRAQTREKLDALGPAPKPPPHPMLLISDPTPEALVMHLAEGRPWGGLFTAEGGVLIGGSAFNDETKMRTGALLNLLWDGEPIRRRRVGTGVHYLPGRRCSAHLMMQPTVATRLFADGTLDGIGTLARTLVVAPESTAGTRLFREPPASVAAILEKYEARLLGLVLKPPPTLTDDPDVLDPFPLTLNADARRMWIDFHNAVERAQVPEGELRPIRAFASKMPEHAGRLAAVLTLYADPDAVEVSAEAMANGTKLAQHYAAELMRLLGGAAIAPDLILADRLLRWWQGRPEPALHLAAIYQRGLNAIGDAATARRIVVVLEDHGHVRRLPPGTVLDGAPRREAWELVP